MDAGFVGEGTETGDGIVERDVDLDGVRNELLEILQLGEIILRMVSKNKVRNA